jgi:tRNA threonylcarbamoyladenosine biosynthesis protein TsaB
VAILGIDTAGSASSVALLREEQVLAALCVRQWTALARPTLRTIDLVLDMSGCRLADLTGIVVNIGPGAFTGLRVGLALAHGLALASDKPYIGCTAFEALVALVPEWRGMVCPVLEARRGEVYAAFYRQQDGVLQQQTPGMVVTPEVLCAQVTERTLFLGSGVPAYRDAFMAALGERAICRETGLEEVGLAVSLARVGGVRLRAAAHEMLPVPRPLYIRAADARLPRYGGHSVTREESAITSGT